MDISRLKHDFSYARRVGHWQRYRLGLLDVGRCKMQKISREEEKDFEEPVAVKEVRQEEL